MGNGGDRESPAGLRGGEELGAQKTAGSRMPTVVQEQQGAQCSQSGDKENSGKREDPGHCSGLNHDERLPERHCESVS